MLKKEYKLLQSGAAKVSLNVRAYLGSRLLQYGPFGKGNFPAHHQNLATLLHPHSVQRLDKVDASDFMNSAFKLGQK